MADRSRTRTVVTGCTCARLRKASRRVSRLYDEHLERCGLTNTQYSLLVHLKRHDGIGIGALSSMLMMDPTTLTRNLRPLERQGLVEAKADPRDRRNRNLHLSEAGRSALAAARPAWEAAQRTISRVLGSADGPAMAAAIDRMLEKLGD